MGESYKGDTGSLDYGSGCVSDVAEGTRVGRWAPDATGLWSLGC